ncbi:MAG: NAD(P)-dependent oxidoreductase [Myxococcales bacterium]|nr:NAD(P)-dependent oxidoreductase [Myxococcales bacterium]
MTIEETRDAKILITGAAGFTGHHAVMETVKAGFSVRATDVSSRYYSAMFEALGVEFVKSDLTERDNLEALLDGIDGVFHVAGIHDYSTPRALMVAVNVNAVANLCDACISAGVTRFIHLSSAGVYGYDWHDKTPVKEDARKLTPPLNVYNETKWAGEQVVHRFISDKGLHATILRPGAIYGTRSEYGIHNAVKHVYSHRDKRKIMMLGSGDYVEGFVHVEDVCRAMIYAFNHDSMIGEAYNVADDSRWTTAEFFSFLSRELFGEEKPFFQVPVQVMVPVAAVSELVAKSLGAKSKLERDTLHYMSCDRIWDNTKIKQAGFALKHPDVRPGMKQTLDWYKDNGWL